MSIAGTGYGSSDNAAYIALTPGSTDGFEGRPVRPVETQAVNERGIPARNSRRVISKDNFFSELVRDTNFYAADFMAKV
jgi:hypothetical protein